MTPFIYRQDSTAVPAPLCADGTPDLDKIRATFDPADTLVEPQWNGGARATPVANLANDREVHRDTVVQLKSEHPQYFKPEPLRAWFAVNAGGQVRTDWDEKRKAYVAVGFRTHDEASAYWHNPARAERDRAWGVAERSIV